MTSVRECVRQAFLEVHNGRSTDDVVIDPDLNALFLRKCQGLRLAISDQDANWALLNLRKSSGLGGVTTHRLRCDHSSYEHAAQIAARLTEDHLSLTIDRVLCDPKAREYFDAIATGIVPGISVYGFCKAALGLRKSRRLRPELIKRVVDWDRKVVSVAAADLIKDLDRIPRLPGVYIFRDATGYLYVGEASNLRTRVAKHLDHSDRKALARYLWSNGISAIVIELHSFNPDSDARLQSARRAYESDLIASREPRFNLRP